MSFLPELKKFLARGNVMELAVAVVMGNAFGAVVKALVDDVIMPPLGLLVGKMDFSHLAIVLKQGSPPGPYESLAAAEAAGATLLRWGAFLNTLLTFLLIGVSVFLLLRLMRRIFPERKEEEAKPAPRTCPYCIQEIPTAASRCPFCTSELGAA